ncbi:hypothetical protein MBRA1_001480 [Malassezia brasiliensis]|uniref:Uncharacterized protein n=1 Tax=Malassezia brasiliensis TaxID=1821822 RepID=A0AAF0DRQ9_9BASI|nr:hypothetical protein MBRA1_001480 [Malassezia brasiliensis]
MDEGGATAVRTALARLDLVPRGGVSRATLRYAHELARSPLEVLEQQPAQQQATRAMLQHQLADVCMRSTGVFVAAQDAVESVPKCVAACSKAVDAIAMRHAPRVRAAADRLAATAPAALAERAARVRVEEAWDAGVGSLVALPRALEACVARGDDDEALRIARHLLTTCAPDDAVRRALLHEVDTALAGMHARVLAVLCASHAPLPRVRRAARTLDELADVAATHGPRAWAMRRDAVCAAFLAARFVGVERALRVRDVARSVDAWHDAVQAACTCALSLWVDAPGNTAGGGGVGPDRASGLVTAAFAMQSVAVLRAHLAAALAALVRDAAGARAWEACGATLATVHARIVRVGTSCAALGVPLDGVAEVVMAHAPALFSHALGGTARAAQAADADDLAWDAMRRGVTAALNALRVYAPEAVGDEVRARLDAFLAEARTRWAARTEAWVSFETRARAALSTIYGAGEAERAGTAGAEAPA